LSISNSMKKISLIIAFCYTASGFAQQKTMDFEKYDPVSTLKVPEHIITKAKFPFIDVHNHQWNLSEQTIPNLLADMDKLNMAVMVNLSGGNGSRLEDMTKSIRSKSPKQFIVFANIDFKG